MNDTAQPRNQPGCSDQLGHTVFAGDWIVGESFQHDFHLYRAVEETWAGFLIVESYPARADEDYLELDSDDVIVISKITNLDVLIQNKFSKISRPISSDFLGQELEVGNWVAVSYFAGHKTTYKGPGYRIGKIASITNEWISVDLIRVPGWSFREERITRMAKHSMKVEELPMFTPYLLGVLCHS